MAVLLQDMQGYQWESQHPVQAYPNSKQMEGRNKVPVQAYPNSKQMEGRNKVPTSCTGLSQLQADGR